MPLASMAHVKYNKYINNLDEEIVVLRQRWCSYHCTSKSGDVAFGNAFFFFHLRIPLPQAGQKIPHRYGALKCKFEI